MSRLRASRSMLGAFGAAVLSSACCWLPLVLVLAGGSALGLAAVFERLRPGFLIVSGVLLAFAYYRVFFAAEDACCDAEGECRTRPARRTTQVVLLGLATVGVIAMAMFPSYASHLGGGGSATAANGVTAAPVPEGGGPASAAGTTSPAASGGAGDASRAAAAATVRLRIGGMTCEGCALTVAKALERVDGVESADVSYEDALAVVRLRNPRVASPQALVDAVRRAGYEARPLAGR